MWLFGWRVGRVFHIIWCLVGIHTPAQSVPIDNGILGEPRVACFTDAIQFTFASKNEFYGKTFVKGQFDRSECKRDSLQNGFTQLDTGNNSFRVQFGTCNIQRQRSVNPRGVFMRSTIVVQFHPIFLTKVDRAFHVQCFYMETGKTLTAAIQVSMLTTAIVEDVYPMPICSYSIRRDNFDGDAAKFLRVGAPVVHRWSCTSSKGHHSENPYGMLVHSCFVEDGSGNKVLLIDENGCGMDPYILGHPVYSSDLLKVYRETHVFKFADRNVLYFSCQIRLCFKSMDTCRGMTPPRCLPLKNKRSIGNSRNLYPVTETNDSRLIPNSRSHDTLDVQTKRLIVFDPDDLGFPHDQSDEKTEVDPQICIAHGSAILLSVLMGIIALFSIGVLSIVFIKTQRIEKMKTDALTARMPSRL